MAQFNKTRRPVVHFIELPASFIGYFGGIYLRNYTIVDWFGYNLTPRERMRAIYSAGFNGVILLWTDQFDRDYKDFPRYAMEAGLYVENAHAPYIEANSLWEDNPIGSAYAEKLITCIEDCAAYEIPTLVLHPTNGKTPLPVSDIGIERLKRIIDKAETLNINIAVENMESPQYLAYIFSNIQSDRLGFCFDSGHHNLHSPDLDLLGLYGDKLMALHLHDNNGKEDMHALPFSGSIDWTKLSAKLKAVNYKGAVALETRNTGFEHIESTEEFLAIAIEKAKAIL
jgi:sugar phosphate isomerase/epimerase